MSESPESPETQETQNDPIVQLRNEFNEQFAALKSSFESSIAERDDTISKLKEENDSLHRALIRSAMTEPAPAPKSEQDLYKEQVESLAKKTLSYMSLR